MTVDAAASDDAVEPRGYWRLITVGCYLLRESTSLILHTLTAPPPRHAGLARLISALACLLLPALLGRPSRRQHLPAARTHVPRTVSPVRRKERLTRPGPHKRITLLHPARL